MTGSVMYKKQVQKHMYF